MRRVFISLFIAVTCLGTVVLAAAGPPSHPLLLAHYMPWFEADEAHGKWGWHWTMNHFDPNRMVAGDREIASHYHPLIGPYDSDDPNLLAYHVMLMKLSGIDGVLIDWYGTDNYLDYGGNQKRTLHLIEEIKKANLRFGIVYEDQTVPRLIDGKVVAKDNVEQHFNEMFRWMDREWFHDAHYLKLSGRPVLLVFGPQYFKDDQWNRLFSGVSPQPAFFTLMNPKGPAIGAFAWPYPHDGDAGSAKSIDEFYGRAKSWSSFIPVALPRFDDIYHEAGVSPSWGHVSGSHNQLYEQLLRRGIASNPPFVQLATWNDWGEGTTLEPAREFGFEPLVTTQRVRKETLDPEFKFKPQDLQLVEKWYQLCKKLLVTKSEKLRAFPGMVYAGKMRQARALIDTFSP